VDLNEPVFTNPLCYTFQKNVPSLSKQKFSSNVVEKCLRHADKPVASMMVDEMLRENELEKMLRDSFANYVVQTALEHTDEETRKRLTDAIRPILPSIRGTPYGRRIQTKILGMDEGGLLPSPIEASAGQSRYGKNMANGGNSYGAAPGSRGNVYGNGVQNGFASETSMGRNPFAAQQGPVASSNNLSKGASSFVPFEARKPQQQYVQHQNNNMNRGQRMPPANGFNYF
jgi:hypothetical protein